MLHEKSGKFMPKPFDVRSKAFAVVDHAHFRDAAGIACVVRFDYAGKGGEVIHIELRNFQKPEVGSGDSVPDPMPLEPGLVQREFDHVRG